MCLAGRYMLLSANVSFGSAAGNQRGEFMKIPLLFPVNMVYGIPAYDRPYVAKVTASSLIIL